MGAGASLSSNCPVAARPVAAARTTLGPCGRRRQSKGVALCHGSSTRDTAAFWQSTGHGASSTVYGRGAVGLTPREDACRGPVGSFQLRHVSDPLKDLEVP